MNKKKVSSRNRPLKRTRKFISSQVAQLTNLKNHSLIDDKEILEIDVQIEKLKEGRKSLLKDSVKARLDYHIAQTKVILSDLSNKEVRGEILQPAQIFHINKLPI
jgi:hypothetical protein